MIAQVGCKYGAVCKTNREAEFEKLEDNNVIIVGRQVLTKLVHFYFIMRKRNSRAQMIKCAKTGYVII